MTAEGTVLEETAPVGDTDTPEEEAAVEPTEAVSDVEEPKGVPDIDRIDPVPSAEVELQSGTVVMVQPLKTRQFFRMLRIITRGGAHVLGSLNLSAGLGDEEFAGQLIMVLIMAVPEAENEAVEFIQSMVLPKDLPSDSKEAVRVMSALRDELENPELEDTISILEVVVRREGPDIKALGERLRKAIQFSDKSGETNLLTS